MAVKELPYRDRGIMPDFTVVPTITDVIQHKDVQLAYAARLAGNE
jgi:hypothetical protein